MIRQVRFSCITLLLLITIPSLSFSNQAYSETSKIELSKVLSGRWLMEASDQYLDPIVKVENNEISGECSDGSLLKGTVSGGKITLSRTHQGSLQKYSGEISADYKSVEGTFSFQDKSYPWKALFSGAQEDTLNISGLWDISKEKNPNLGSSLWNIPREKDQKFGISIFQKNNKLTGELLVDGLRIKGTITGHNLHFTTTKNEKTGLSRYEGTISADGKSISGTTNNSIEWTAEKFEFDDSEKTVLLSKDVLQVNDSFWNSLEWQQLGRLIDYQGYYPWETLPPVQQGRQAIPVTIIVKPFICEKKEIICYEQGDSTKREISEIDLRGLPVNIRNKIIGGMAVSGAFRRIYLEERIRTPFSTSSDVYLKGSISKISFKKPLAFKLRGDIEKVPEKLFFKDVSAMLNLYLEDYQGDSLWSKEIDLSTQDYSKKNGNKNTQTVFSRELDAAITAQLFKEIDNLIGEIIAIISSKIELDKTTIRIDRIKKKELVPVTILTSFKTPNIFREGSASYKEHKKVDFYAIARHSFLLLDYTIDAHQEFEPFYSVLWFGSVKEGGVRFDCKKTVWLFPGNHTIAVGIRVPILKEFIANYPPTSIVNPSGKIDWWSVGLSTGEVLTKDPKSRDYEQIIRAKSLTDKGEISDWLNFGHCGKIEIDVEQNKPFDIEAYPLYREKKFTKGIMAFKLYRLE
jgi:hypothetical protein